MANDYVAVNFGIAQLIALGQADVVLNYVDPTTYVNLRQVNQIGFGVPAGNAPVIAGNLNVVNQVNARLINPEDANTIHRNFQPLGGSNMSQKVLFQYTDGSYGFSEVWYAPDGAPVSRANLIAYLNRRLAFSGDQTTIVRARTSTVGQRNSYMSYTGPELLTGPNALTSVFGQMTANRGANVQNSDIANTCMNVVCRAIAPTARTRRIFLRGLPDDIIQAGGVFTDNIGWTPIFNNWANYITNTLTWGWVGQPGTAQTRYQITAMTNTNGQISITASGNIFTQVGGQWVPTPVRIAKLPQPFGFLNGALVIQPTSATSGLSIRQMPFPAGATFAAGPAVVYLQSATVFYATNTMSLGFPGRRDAGNPFPRHRGRARNRVWS